MANREQQIIEYIKKLLFDVRIAETMPEELLEVEGMEDIDTTLRSLRTGINSIGVGELSAQIQGRGYAIGVVKNLQATLKNLTWHTKAISAGDFSERVVFLGEFSRAFNEMVKKLESAMLEVQETRDLFEMLFATIPDATMIVSLETGEMLNCNLAFGQLIGYTKEEILGRPIDELDFFKDEEQENIFYNSIEGKDEEAYNVFIELKLKDGEPVHGLFSSSIVSINNEKYILSVIKDLTEMKVLSEKLRKSEEIHRLLADHASDVIWTMDLDGKFNYISPSVEKMRGYTAEEVMAQSKEELLCPSSYAYFDQGLEIERELIRNNLPFQDFRGDVEQPCKDGSSVWTEMTVSGIYDKDNRFVCMLGVSRDISERLQMEEEIRRLSETDGLTQLNNRMKLDEILNQEMERLKRSESVCSVILMDLDNFKNINDTCGHLMGDEVLKGVAGIIRENVRQIDTVGRWGGEEFMVIMPLTDINGGKLLAEKLRKKIEEHTFSDIGSVTASFGVAENRGDLSEIEWVAIADQALYKAKKSGRNRVCPRP